MWSKSLFIYVALCVSTTSADLLGDSCSPSDLLYNKGPCQNITLTCDDSTNQCVPRGCRTDEVIYEWPSDLQLPPMCNTTEYCPNDQLRCLPRVKFGDICSVGRDDSCEGENGICLNQRCFTKSIQLGRSCIIDDASAYLVNRDNCQTGFFCSTSNNVCVDALANNEPCTEDRQCHSGTCKQNVCEDEVEYNRFPVWGYVLIAVGCVVVIGSCVLFIYFRRRHRMKAYKKSMAEIESYRQSILTNSSPTNASNMNTSPTASHKSTEQFKS